MRSINIVPELDDFSRFCLSLDSRKVIAAADNNGNAQGYQKEIYALAVLRALYNGDFGEDPCAIQAAVSAFWQHGYADGFSINTFNRVFENHFAHW